MDFDKIREMIDELEAKHIKLQEYTIKLQGELLDARDELRDAKREAEAWANAVTTRVDAPKGEPQ